MAAKLTDAHLDAEAIQIELLRNASIARRLSICCSLTQAAIHQSRRALASANPELGRPELDLLFVRLQYGTELADGVQRHLEARGR